MSGIKSIAEPPSERGQDHPRYKTYLVHGMVTYRVVFRYPGDGEHEARSRQVIVPSTDIGQLQMMLTDPQRGIPIILAMHVGEDQVDQADQVEQAPPVALLSSPEPLALYTALVDWMGDFGDLSPVLVVLEAGSRLDAQEDAQEAAAEHLSRAGVTEDDAYVVAFFDGDMSDMLSQPSSVHVVKLITL